MSGTPYGFDPAKVRAAQRAAGLTLDRLAELAGLTDRAVRQYLAESRTPRPSALVGIARALGVDAAQLCTAEPEAIHHLRIFTGRCRDTMAAALGIPSGAYRRLEVSGERTRFVSNRYCHAQHRWMPWFEWAPAVFEVTPERLRAAERHTRESCRTGRQEDAPHSRSDETDPWTGKSTP